METSLFLAEKGLLIVGLLFILTGMVQYGRRSHDWKGVVTMFYKRVPMNVSEYKHYRLGVALVIAAIVIRFAFHIFWPQF
ncbi:hypothetical protein [Vibrio methylphosphonaticus]|uniref:hypothetical protein n=1 Tax=Vibrio methylphosphonaticus TaxID=2946866 RepID=UPI002029D280|nr:hypothetical protein [Vibrio methylphosphonaticus]MCL9773950.1 hypothetical protein [Vibrio methylphosphonaticus]